MTDTFSPSIAPAPAGTSGTDTERVKEAVFGDGYSQRAADGLNNVKRSATLSWDVLTQTQYDEINGFFVAHGGGAAFLYTLPLESLALKWKWTTKSPGYVGGNTRSLRVSIERVFDLSAAPAPATFDSTLITMDNTSYTMDRAA